MKLFLFRRIALLIAFALLMCVVADAQSKLPFTKSHLLEILRLNGLTVAETVIFIARRGVDFQLTPAIERELLGVGARPEIINAVSRNFRLPMRAKTFDNVQTPYGFSEIVELVKSKTPLRQIENMIARRGVIFRLDARLTATLRATGASPSLINFINKNYRLPPEVIVKASYENSIEKAMIANSNRNYREAVAQLHRAVALAPNEPLAYQLAGFVELYGTGNIASSAEAMQAALARGGAAAFRVAYVQPNVAQGNAGTMFITKQNVSFKPDDDGQSLMLSKTGIAAINRSGDKVFRRILSTEKARVQVTTRDGKSYVFIASSGKSEEAWLIEKLIKQR